MPTAARSVQIRVPASTANLGPGFDSIGLALGLWDEYVATALDRPGLEVSVTGEGAAEVPTDESHLVVRTMRHTWETLEMIAPAGLRLRACNGVPHGRGLGSSATAIVAGVLAAQALPYAAELAPGATVPVDLGVATHIASVLEGHPDNASASVYGGLTVSWMPDGSGADLGEVTVTARPVVHPDVEVVVFVPDQQLSTRHARAVLPDAVPLKYQASGARRVGPADEWLTVKLRYQPPEGGSSTLLSQTLKAGDERREVAGDFAFAAAVAEYGMLLRESEYRGSASWDEVLRLASQGRGEDTYGIRGEFIRLVHAARGALEKEDVARRE